MRKIYIAGNWKMNKTFQEADDFFFRLGEYLQSCDLNMVETLICPPYLYLELATDTADETNLSIGSQNVSQYDQGAYTGEISADMLSAMNIDYCLVGHSERRQYFNESNQVINAKIKQLRKFFIKPVLCLGETLQQRENNITFEFVESQLRECLEGIEIDQNLVIAYEPIWAIGTGKTASPEQAQEVHRYIRQWIEGKYGKETAENIPILYGGSVKPANLSELLAQPDIDGGLIGGASLDIKSYIEMLEIAINQNK